MNMKEKIYEKQCELLVHYSSRMFAARVSIITISILLVAFVLGIWVPKDFIPVDASMETSAPEDSSGGESSSATPVQGDSTAGGARTRLSTTWDRHDAFR